MEEFKVSKQQIIDTLLEKASLKQTVYEQTKKAFETLKEALHETSGEYNNLMRNKDERIYLEYVDKGIFEAELKVAGDLLIFHMHSNIFEFPRNHEIWQNNYYKESPLKTYSGIINIYNFLSDSFRYNRLDDLGYLIGRIFINKDYTFFIEGRRELGFNYPAFDKNEANKENFRTMIESAIVYVLKFDLLVPPYNDVKIVTVDQMKEKINKSKLQTGKRMGFQYNAIE
jgi:hypothetical protein